METKIKIILMDDIHIEGRSEEQIISFQKTVQEKIEEVKSLNLTPVVVCAGDIGEGIKGIEWAKELSCDVIYTCGNHEFWNRDYFETYNKIYEELKKEEYKNIHFLNNSTIELYGVRFIGGTMWTSVGSYLNWYEKRNLSIKYFPVMGDFRKITIKGWYTEENTKRLKEFILKNTNQMNQILEENVNGLINGNFFNPLFELDIHNETINYIREELAKKYEGKTVVVTHHLPDFMAWAKAKKMNTKVLEGEYLNNDRLLLEGAKGTNKMYRDAMLIGYYSNDLSDLMFGDLAPDYWMHGHLHIPVQNIIGKTKIVSSPVGYHSQSSVITMKEFELNDYKTFVAQIIEKETEEYFKEEIIIKNLLDFEKAIKIFESLVSANFVSNLEFKIILNQFKLTHQNNIDLLKKTIIKWLSLILYQENTELKNKEQDYFNVILKSGILLSKSKLENGDEIKFKLPDYLFAELGEASFKDEGEENKNTNIKFWKSEINKIIVQVKNLRKILSEYVKDLESKDKLN